MKLGYRALISAFVLFSLSSCSSSSTPNSNTNLSNSPDETVEDGSISLGVLLDFSGPIASLTTHMAAAAELAIAEVSDSGKLLGGTTVIPRSADSTCTDPVKGLAAFEQLVSNNVSGVVGASCSGTTIKIVNEALVSSGMVMVSPASSGSALSNIDDEGLFYRTVSSDVRMAYALSQILLNRNIQTAAVTYTNNSYGFEFQDVFKNHYESNGGAVTISLPHEDEQVNYSTEVSALAAAGGDILVVLGYYDNGGAVILEESVSTGSFTQYALGDGMVNEGLFTRVSGLPTAFGVRREIESNSTEDVAFQRIADGFDASSALAAESYDAAALILLAMQAAESSDSSEYKSMLIDVANAPGEKIYAGELGRALDLISSGAEIDYVGASRIELTSENDSVGSFMELEVQDDAFVFVRVLTGEP